MTYKTPEMEIIDRIENKVADAVSNLNEAIGLIENMESSFLPLKQRIHSGMMYLRYTAKHFEDSKKKICEDPTSGTSITSIRRKIKEHSPEKRIKIKNFLTDKE